MQGQDQTFVCRLGRAPHISVLSSMGGAVTMTPNSVRSGWANSCWGEWGNTSQNSVLGSLVARSIECPVFGVGSGHDLRVMGSNPILGSSFNEESEV